MTGYWDPTNHPDWPVVPDDHPPPDRKRVVYGTLRWAIADLDLPDLRVEWFEARSTGGPVTLEEGPDGPISLSGYQPQELPPTRIRINCGCTTFRFAYAGQTEPLGYIIPRPLDVLARAVLHECHHVRDMLDRGRHHPGTPAFDEVERRAVAYAASRMAAGSTWMPA